jgi:hypothetical protein
MRSRFGIEGAAFLSEFSVVSEMGNIVYQGNH